ncbi:hypothetical protein SCARD494_02691 [Seiridium cardinale]
MLNQKTTSGVQQPASTIYQRATLLRSAFDALWSTIFSGLARTQRTTFPLVFHCRVYITSGRDSSSDSAFFISPQASQRPLILAG